MVKVINKDYFNTKFKEKYNLIITEPPHKKDSYQGVTGRGLERFQGKIPIEPSDLIDLDLTVLAKRLFHDLEDGGTLIIFYDKWRINELKNVLQEVGFNSFRLLVWSINNPVPLNCKRNYIANGSELFLSASKGTKKAYNHTFHNGTFSYNRVKTKMKKHYYQKPRELIYELILQNTNENDLILDPFCGSGDFGYVAINNNRSFTGVEINPKYYKMANKLLTYHTESLL